MFRLTTFIQLQSNGLLRYSTAVIPTSGDRKPPHFIINYLTNSLKFSKQDAVVLSTKGNLTHLKSLFNSELVVNTFKIYGLTNTQIKDIVFSAPKILTCKPHKTLEPKIRVFRDLGLSGSDLSSLIKRNPQIIWHSLNTRIIPYLNNLKRLVGSDENVVRIINKSKRLYFTDSWMERLSKNVEILEDYGLVNERIAKIVLSKPGRLTRILTNISSLKRYGLSDEKIFKLMITNPSRMQRKPELFESKLVYVEEKLGISRDSNNFIPGVIVVMYRSETEIERKRRIFRSFGWSDYEIATLIRAEPYFLGRSESNINKLLNFFLKELNYSPSYLKGCTCFWTCSLEKRMKPRYEVLKILKEKKLIKDSLRFGTYVQYPELKFIGFLKNFESEIPSLCETYMKSIKNSKAEA